MTETFDRMIALTEDIITHPVIQSGLAEPIPATDAQRGEQQRLLNSELTRLVFRYSKVSDVLIFRPDRSLQYTAGYSLYLETDLEQIQTGIAATAQNMFWTSIKNRQGDTLVALGRTVYDTDDFARPLGRVVLILEERPFSREAFYGVKLGEETQLSLLSRDGTIITSAPGGPPNGTRLGDPALLNRLATIKDELPNSFRWTITDRSGLICATAIPQPDWVLTAWIP
ncbi:MAG: hypothetical protein Q8M76_05085, partial [Spirochaetaceae bacterium]|nr:hypothetical protein [Spirochaetaceae bacterium]